MKATNCPSSNQPSDSSGHWPRKLSTSSRVSGHSPDTETNAEGMKKSVHTVTGSNDEDQKKTAGFKCVLFKPKIATKIILNLQTQYLRYDNDRMESTVYSLKHISGLLYDKFLFVSSRNLTYLLSQFQTHWWRPVAWGSWTRWRGVYVVSVVGAWPLWQASSERRAWGMASHWLAVSWCPNDSREEVLFSSFPAFCYINFTPMLSLMWSK